MSILIFLIVLYLLLSLTMYKLFEKAGEPAWQALVPGLNFMVMCRMVGQPNWWAALLLIPVVNIFIFCGLCVDMTRSFGKLRFWHTALSVIFAPAMFYLIGNNKEDKYIGKTLDLEKDYAQKLDNAYQANDTYNIKKLEANNPYKKNAIREWVEAIVFAVFAAAFIRMFLIEAYVIPTSSMEGSLLVGDFLFVSKAHYGIRMPMTIAQIPLLHNRMPFGDMESYATSPRLGYHRLPTITAIKRNDPVVFNYPEGDSVYIFPERTFSISDVRNYKKAGDGSLELRIKTEQTPLVVRPLDKEDFYIKRCVAIAGDSVQVKNRQLYINGKPAENPSHMQHLYQVKGNVNKDKLDEWGVNLAESNPSRGIYFLNDEQVKKIAAIGGDVKIDTIVHPANPNGVFPHAPEYFPTWSVDNYGPVFIPKQGVSVALTPQNMTCYRRVISIYEGNKLEEKGGKIFINGAETTTYTFKQNYYWMMGDNRHNSEDARVWGYVPEDHVVGKPLFIWFSTKNGNMKNGINWGRIFTGANKM